MPSNDQVKRPAGSVSRPAKPEQAATAAKSTGAGVKERPGQPASPRTTGSVVTRRQSRARERMLARKRRNNTIVGVISAIVIVAAFVLLLRGLHSSGKSKTGSAANACPTATSVNGPTAVQTPSATPPALPTNAKIVNGDQGLQYVDITPGCGAEVQQGDTAIVEYTGWLQSTGKEFDSSFSHQPSECGGTVQYTCGIQLADGQSIQGWINGVPGMKVGGTRRLIIPAALGYGANANGPIPANSNLIFDITLVAIQ